MKNETVLQSVSEMADSALQKVLQLFFAVMFIVCAVIMLIVIATGLYALFQP